MRRKVFKRSVVSSAAAAFAAIAFTALITVMVLYGISRAERASVSEGRQILEDGLRRAVVVCYAGEGIYPESLSYIEENYGVIIDRSKYAVFYEIEGSNIFPEITVLEIEEGF